MNIFGMSDFICRSPRDCKSCKLTKKFFENGVDFCSPIVYYIYGLQKRGDKMSHPKGRPTENPKGKPVHIRLDEKSDRILAQYTNQENVSKAEAIRRGIAKLESDIKK